MIDVRFGGPLGEVLDGISKSTVRPRCTGVARLLARDAEHFAAAIPEMGGEEAVSVWAQGTILQHVGRALVLLAADRGVVGAMNDARELAARATPGIDEELAQIGARVELGAVEITLAPDDIQALRAATAAEARRREERAMRPALPTQFVPGTRVVARWTDGRESAATVRNFDGTYYEIVWDGASESTFIAADRVRPLG